MAALPDMPKPFWQKKTLEELSPDEWESLCDHCGLCCLVRLEDEDTGVVYETTVACSHYDCANNQCRAYSTRGETEDGCIELTPALVRQFDWLPDSCAYRTVMRGEPLPETHPLICGTRSRTATVTDRFASVGLVTNAQDIDPEQYLVVWDEPQQKD